MDFTILKERLRMVAERITEIGGTVRELVVDPPATESEIAEVEKIIGRNRRLLRNFAIRHRATATFTPAASSFPMASSGVSSSVMTRWSRFSGTILAKPSTPIL